MRYSADQVRQGILHPDKEVRFACLQYFAESFSPDRTVMPTAIEALERYGRKVAFPFLHLLTPLAQTEETIRWVLEELKSAPPRTNIFDQYPDILSRLLLGADPTLTQPHEQEILSCPNFNDPHREAFAFRLGLLSLDGDTLWRDLEKICEVGKGQQVSSEMRYDQGEWIIAALAAQGNQHVERMSGLLAIRVEEYENNPLTWLQPLMVRLAGELRHEPSVPRIVELLHEDHEVQSEECQTALIRIGTDAVVQAVREDYAGATIHFRLFATGVLEHVHSDQAVQAGIDLLPTEEDGDIRSWLAQALASQFSTEANEVARTELLNDPDSYDLLSKLVAACTLMDQRFPELEEWRQELDRINLQATAPTRLDPPILPPWRPPLSTAPSPHPPPRLQPLRTEKKVGRNDPCPCGSGKKFKKCCMP